MKAQNKPHYWSYCSHCEADMIICGNCGNNCCNGGYGTLDDGSTCTMCKSAYEKQANEYESYMAEMEARRNDD